MRDVTNPIQLSKNHCLPRQSFGEGGPRQDTIVLPCNLAQPALLSSNIYTTSCICSDAPIQPATDAVTPSPGGEGRGEGVRNLTLIWSSDVIDVYFTQTSECIAVETKSRISDVNDITRGIFQCEKYQAVLEASLLARGQKADARHSCS